MPEINALQADDIIFRVWELATPEDKKVLVCEVDNQSAGSVDSTDTDTKCGTLVGFGTAKVEFSGNAVFNTVPTSEEASYNDVFGWMNDGVDLGFEMLNAAFTNSSGDSVAEGGVLYQTGVGRFTAVTLTGATTDIGKFSWTLKPQGQVSTVQAS